MVFQRAATPFHSPRYEQWQFRPAALIAVVVSACSLVAAPSSSQSAPAVFMVSEGVKPEDVATLFGDGLIGALKVRIEETGTLLSPVQQDPAGRYLRIILPSVTPGVYSLRISTDGGISWADNPNRPICLNRPDPRWLSDTRLYAGLKLQLLGRNLDAREYGKNTRTEIRLVSAVDGHTLPAEVGAVSPYCAELIGPAGIGAGKEYFVEVRTGSAGRGGEWVRLRDYPDYNETKVGAVARPSDPLALELGVGWAGEFHWNNVKNVRTAFQAKGDGQADDTEAIQKAIDQAGSEGGGVVCFPQGTYRYRTLSLDRGVILKGESNTRSVLMKFQGGACLATVNKGSTDGYIGIANLKMIQQAGHKPEYAFLLGYSKSIWDGNYDCALLTAKNIFIYNSVIDYTENGTRYDHGTWGLVANVKGPLLFKNNYFRDRSPGWLVKCRQRLTAIGNEYHWCDWCVLETQADKLILARNKFHGHFISGVSDKSQGPKGLFYSCYAGAFATEKWGTWIAGNVYDGIPSSTNDGGGPATDGYASILTGQGIAAAANSVRVRQIASREDRSGRRSNNWSDGWHVYVAAGKGLGQIRRLVGHAQDGLTHTLSVAPAWDVRPDETSLVCVAHFTVNMVCERDSGANLPGAAWYLWNSSYDNVCADMEMHQAGGAYILGEAQANNGIFSSAFCSINRRQPVQQFPVRHPVPQPLPGWIGSVL